MAVFLLFCSPQFAQAHGHECEDQAAFDLLPELVQTTRHDIIETAQFGNMNPMLEIVDRNEIWPVPDFRPEATYDQAPIYSWNEQSQDTHGRYILAQMIEVLSLPYIKKPLIEGVDLYIWPYFAEDDIRGICDIEKIDLLKITSPEDYKKMRETGFYTGFQLAITTDGSWQYFARKNIGKTRN